MASITCNPAAPVATKSACAITVADGVLNDPATYDADNYPSEDEVRYYLTFEKGGAILGKSYVFSVDGDLGHVFPNYIFPSSGSWTVRLSKVVGDASVTTQAVTVS